MDLNSIKVQRGPLFIISFQRLREIALIQIEIFRCLWCDWVCFCVCFSIPSHGAGTWSICSLRVMMALNSLFRATSAGSWQQAMGRATAGPRSRRRRSTQWRGEATTCILYIFFCLFFFLKDLYIVHLLISFKGDTCEWSEYLFMYIDWCVLCILIVLSTPQ